MEKDQDKFSELRKEFNGKKKELSQLRFQLNSLNLGKEGVFKELKFSREKVKSLLNQIDSFKKERDDLTKKVKELKKERDELNSAVKTKSNSKKEAEEKKKSLLDKMDSRESPGKIKDSIQQLEETIETEVIPFSQEQKIRKQIKELKSQYQKMKGLEEVWKTIKTSNIDFTETRRKAEHSHKNIQELAKQSQEIHEQINKLYGEVKKLRGQEQPLAEKYLNLKKEYTKLKENLEELLSRVNELNKLFKKEENKSNKTKINEQTTAVKEKIMKKQKLSMEDILAFQASKE